MKYFKFLLLTFAIFSNLIFSQSEDEVAKDLKKIYESLEYNTIAFNDLKQKWIINDPTFIREIYNKFVVNDALTIEGKSVPLDVIKSKTQDIYDSKIVIDLRKRYYDDEVEYFAFISEEEIGNENPKFMFDPVTDGFYLKEILGERIYEKIKTESYFLNNITKKDFDVKTGYYFDIYMNLLNPEIMYWNTTSDFRNKYLLSAFGKWGNDYIFIPGWYSREYTVGSKLTYYKTLAQNPDDYTYQIALGVVQPANGAYKGNAKKPLFVSGNAAYFKISGDFLRFIDEDLKDYQVNIEVKYTGDDFKTKDYGINYTMDFYSNRLYYVFNVKKRNWFNLFDLGMFELGGGYSLHDINHYQINPGAAKVANLDGNKSMLKKLSFFPFVEWGLSRYGGLIQHSISGIFSYSPDGFGYIGMKVKVMLSDTFGFDTRFFGSFYSDKKKFPEWRNDQYIVFSSVLRINY